ncbi:hypothetical protein GGD56_001600 [Rhizobium mongolense]|uniref:Uncharacterized protein n=2 Tax=Rhizobium mongolense TaxID=57676 RepID=A0ABR6IIT3_9HYPH|nr:hypothetical protein [Rhizobium mongolense]TVZ65066.1 hypothetical protein BCL32_5347 [Rhizobium mongolense USDA 1844]
MCPALNETPVGSILNTCARTESEHDLTEFRSGTATNFLIRSVDHVSTVERRMDRASFPCETYISDS